MSSHPFAGKRIAVVMGGLSAEREVSLNTGAGVIAALLERGWDAVALDWRDGTSLPQLLAEARAEVVWNALHGTWGEDGRVQGLLDWMQIPYTGDGLRACLLSMDKAISKQLFRLRGVPVAADVVWHRGAPGTDPSTAECPFDGKVVVKPVAEGSSVGVTIVQSPEAFRPAVAEAFRVADRILVERFVEGGIQRGVVALDVLVRKINGGAPTD
jgi:D-alanine--D-alanine ligase